jgi:peptide-methionine (S)-S-oxide reductase
LIKVKQVILLIVLILKFEMKAEDMEQATFGAGCFWCIEAIFEQIDGVNTVKSGYMGGDPERTTYDDICTGTSGHAEVIHVLYNPETVSYTQLLEVFFSIHDPTTLNKQGYDAGTQYRSAIFYHSDDQRSTAEHVIAKLTEDQIWDDPIVTEITLADAFYSAEVYHQNYFESNKEQPYCNLVIKPKVEKFKKVFSNLLKEPIHK